MQLLTGRWKILWFVLWTLLAPWACAGTGAASPPVSGQAAAPKAKAPPKTSRGIFYEIRGHGATVFLLGSVHIGKRQFYPLDPPIESAFASADTLVLEIDPRDKEKLLKQVAEASVYPADDSIEKHLDPEVLARLRGYLEQHSVPFDSFRRLKPWTVAVTVIAIEFKKAGFDAEHGIDAHFSARAGTKQIVGLESADEQLNLFTRLDERTQNLMLKQVLEDVHAHAKMIDATALAWLAGDEQHIDRELLEPMRKPEYRELFDQVFVQRNIRMAQAIERLLARKGTHFVVVGAGHVVGKQGIVDLLRSKGHTVERR